MGILGLAVFCQLQTLSIIAMSQESRSGMQGELGSLTKYFHGFDFDSTAAIPAVLF